MDDFGLHAGVNDAALRLAALDRVHAIGCLVGGAAWNKAWSERLRHLPTDGIDIGLHLDFTEAPLSPRSRRPLSSLITDSLLRRLDAPAIRSEIRAQLDAFEQALGREPAFVDGHQHVHQLAVIRRELLEELASRYRGATPWLRSTRAARGACASDHGSWRAFVKPCGIELLGSRALASMARRMGFSQNHSLLGVYDFRGGRERYRGLLAAWLRSASDADLLMCHPSGRLHEGDPLAEARHAEFQVLAGAEFGTILRGADVALRPMSQILARAGQPA